jgi:hypothetical protein
VTPGDLCRVCDGPRPPALPRLHLVPQPSDPPEELRDVLGANWRDTIGEKRDWMCFGCLVWVAELLGLVEKGASNAFRRLVA